MPSVEATFEIRGKYWKENCLPGLNDMLTEASRNPMAYARLKRQMETVTISAARMGLKKWKATERVRLDITWGEKAKGQKRDFDNVVSAGRKIINDALVKAGYLHDDSPKYLAFGDNTFVYTDKPFVKVDIVLSPVETI